MIHHHVLGRVAVAVVAGLATVGIAMALHNKLLISGVAGWAVLALTFCAITWHYLKGMDPDETRKHAVQEEPGRAGIHVAMVLASLAALAGVATLLSAGSSDTSSIPWEALVGTAAVAASWLLVHMLYTTRYAELYYTDKGDEPAVDFSGDDPDYQDFAYLAYTLGMTYQVSDTTLQARRMRRVVLRHCLLAYLLGAVVIASTINLVVSLASGGGGGGS